MILIEAEAATSILSDDRFSKLFQMEDYEVHTSFNFRLVKVFLVVLVCVGLYFQKFEKNPILSNNKN